MRLAVMVVSTKCVRSEAEHRSGSVVTDSTLNKRRYASKENEYSIKSVFIVDFCG